jgi:PBSX family phage terminase large subunit
MKLSERQKLALSYLQDKTTKEILYGGGAGGGKSLLGCYWTAKNSFKFPGSRWLIGRSVLKTLKETTIKTLFEVLEMQGIPSKVYRYNQQNNEIRFYNGSEIIFKDLFLNPSDPNLDELGSLEITGAFIDEAVQIKEKTRNIVKSRIRYKLDEFGLIPKILYASNPGKGWLYNEFYIPFKNGTIGNDKAFIQSLANDNPFISEYYHENLNSLDKESRERLKFGNWDYSPEGITFPEESLKRFDEVDYSNSIIVGYCDVADQGTDYLSFVAGALIGKNIFIIDVVFSQKDSNYTIPKIISLIEKYKMNRVIFESNAMGMMYTKMLKSQYEGRCRIFAQPNNSQKHSRIIAQAQFILDNFYFKNPDRDTEYYQFVDQLTTYRNDKKATFDDAADSLAGLSFQVSKLF